MKILSASDILKMSSLIAHCKIAGQSVSDMSPDFEFQKKHQTSILTEVKREYPDLADSEAMSVYNKAREARLSNDIPRMLELCQQLAEKYWAYWPNTLWFAYALRVYGSETYPQAEVVFCESEKSIRKQIAGELPLNAVPTVEPVTLHHVKEILSMLTNNHAEFYRIQGQFDDALRLIEESINITEHDDMLVRRYLAKAGILAQSGNISEARTVIQSAKSVNESEWTHQIEHVKRHYPGLTQALEEVN